MKEAIASYLAQNIKQLRQSRNMSQEQLARISGVPRPTWSNLESGAANPTVYTAASIPKQRRGGVLIRKLLPDHLQGLELERLELAPAAQMTGTPHRMGTREYLACECGVVELVVSGTKYELSPGVVVVFRGDQKHTYTNRGSRVAVAYSAVVLGPGRIG